MASWGAVGVDGAVEAPSRGAERITPAKPGPAQGLGRKGGRAFAPRAGMADKGRPRSQPVPRAMDESRSDDLLIPQFARYAALGAASFAGNLGLAAVFHELLALPEWLAVALSLSIVFAVNFTAAKLVVYRSRGSWRRELPSFLVLSLSSRALEYAVFLALFALLSVHYLLAAAISQVLSFVLKFFLYRRWVFS